jgi:hypothetical protein
MAEGIVWTGQDGEGISRDGTINLEGTGRRVDSHGATGSIGDPWDGKGRWGDGTG